MGVKRTEQLFGIENSCSILNGGKAGRNAVESVEFRRVYAALASRFGLNVRMKT